MFISAQVTKNYQHLKNPDNTWHYQGGHTFNLDFRLIQEIFF